MFCDVVQQRSFSKAAAAHDVSQSAASQAVHLLEKQLGTLLIDRSKRPFELTPAGEVYYDGCRELLKGYREIEDRILKMRDRVVGTVRVAAIYSVGLLQMDRYVKRFNEKYPEVKVRLEYVHPDEVYEQVLTDEADLGLVSFPRERGEITRELWQEQPMVLVVPPGHRLAGKSEVSAAELNGENFIGFTTELPIRKEMDRWFKRSKLSVNIVHEFDNIENIKRAVEVGSGVAVLPVPTVRREVESGTLFTISLSDVHWVRPLGIVHKRHKSLSTAVQKFIEMLHEDPAPDSGSVPGAVPRVSRLTLDAVPHAPSGGARAAVGAKSADGQRPRRNKRLSK